jgi:hypothetical protein
MIPEDGHAGIGDSKKYKIVKRVQGVLCDTAKRFGVTILIAADQKTETLVLDPTLSASVPLPY